MNCKFFLIHRKWFCIRLLRLAPGPDTAQGIKNKYKKTDTQIQRQRQCQIHKYTLADNNLVLKEKFGINCASAEAQFGTERGIKKYIGIFICT